MADTRTLKLSLLADVAKFTDGMNKADSSTKGLSDKVGKYSKVMAGAFLAVGAAAGVMAVKIGVDSVKAAIEDEASQKKLAQALKNTTKATDKQITATEKYVSATQIRYGISDVKLRDSLGTLLRATNDVTEAQKLNNLAIDISAATGKDLETVSLTLAKAYDGNFTALRKLGVPLDENLIKTKDFNGLTKDLTDTFGGSAQANTETYAGQLAILKQRFGEIQEDIGAKLIPKLKLLLEQVTLVAKGFSGEDPDGLSARARELKGDLGNTGAASLGGTLRALSDSFGTLFAAFGGTGAKDATSTLDTFAGAIQGLANAIESLAGAYSTLDRFTKSKGYQATLDAIFGSKTGGFGTSVFNPFGTNFLGAGALTGARATGGPVSMGGSYLVGERGPEIFTPNTGGRITSNGTSGGVTINLNGIVDAESARRSIEQLIQRSARRTGAIDWVGATL